MILFIMQKQIRMTADDVVDVRFGLRFDWQGRRPRLR